MQPIYSISSESFSYQPMLTKEKVNSQRNPMSRIWNKIYVMGAFQAQAAVHLSTKCYKTPVAEACVILLAVRQ